MLFYILLFLSIVLGMLMINLLKEERDKKFVTGIMFLGLILISGTRFELGGSDYYIYRTGYDAIPTLFQLGNLKGSISDIRLVKDFEIGYLIFNSFVKTLGINFYGYTLIEAGIWYFCMYYGLRRYVDEWPAVIIVFLYKLFFYNTFISMRQSMTIAMFFMAWRLIQDKKVIPYYLTSIFALLLHNGAIIMFVIYPLLLFKLTKKRLLLLNVFAWTIFLFDKLGYSIFFIIKIILNMIPFENTLIYKAKIWISMSYPISTFHVLEYMLLMLLVIIYYDKMIENDENADFILKIFTCLLPVFAIFSGNIVSTRFKDYFTISYGIVLMYLCRLDDAKRKYIVQVGMVVVCAYGYFRYLVNFDAGGLLPYANYLVKGFSIFY